MSRSKNKKIAWSLWIPVTLAFLVVILAWGTLIKIAHEHPTPSVELTAPPAQP